MELSIIKQDVINELRNQRYYNEQEITRLVTTDAVPHKDRVFQIAELVQSNVQLIESVNLMEKYFPAQQRVAPIAPTTNQQSGPSPDEPQQ